MSEISKHRKTNAYFLTLLAGLFATTYDGVKLAEGLRDAIYVTMSQNYIKQITNTWYQIYTIVKDSGNDITSGGVTDDPMERLLRSREAK